MAELDKRYTRILFQKNQSDLVSAPFYVKDNMVAVSAYSGGSGLPPGGRITFQEVVFVDGGRSDGSLCAPGHMNNSQLYDYKPYASCGCEPTLSERMSFMEFHRPGWYRAVYSGPARASVMLVAIETSQAADSCACSVSCCPIDVDLVLKKKVSSKVITAGGSGFFTLEVTNKGPEASTGGSVVDELPTGLTYGVPTAVYTGGATGSQPALAEFANGDWHYTLLPVGGKITITIPFVANGPGSFVPENNKATVFPGPKERDTNFGNNTDNVFFVVVKPSVDVWVTKSAAQENLKEGDTFTFTVTAGNAGPDAANGTTVKDALPGGLVASSIVAVYSGGAVGPQPTQAQLAAGYVVPTFPSGGQVVLTITGTVTKAGYYLNFTSVTAPGGVDDANQGNNSSSANISASQPQADLKAVNKAVSNAKPAVGETITYTGSFINNGPQAANGALVKDSPSSNITITSPITLTYGGGAAGAVTITTAQFLAGYAVPTMPNGGTVAFSYTATVNAGSEGQMILNTISITPPAGVVDPNLLDNTKNVQANVQQKPETVYQSCGKDVTPATNLLSDKSFTVCKDGVEVPFACGMKLKALDDCCETTVLIDSDANVPTGAGVCLAVFPTLFDRFTPQQVANGQGRAILQLRDKAVLAGNVVLDPNGNPGAVLQKTINNPYNCPMLVEVDLYTNDNYATGVYGNEAFTFVHKIGTTYAEPFPVTGGGIDGTVGYHNLNSVGGENSSYPIPGNSYNNEGFYAGRYTTILAPGQSVTVYGQSWLIMYEARNTISGGSVIHANKLMRVRRTLGGAYL